MRPMRVRGGKAWLEDNNEETKKRMNIENFKLGKKISFKLIICKD